VRASRTRKLVRSDETSHGMGVKEPLGPMTTVGLSTLTMEIRAATAGDIETVQALLRECRLPLDGVPEELESLFVASVDGRIEGVAALELHGRDGLLRSVAVSTGCRRRSLGSRLCDEVERRAQVVGARRLFLLTETAEAFFSRRGYRSIERVLAPAAIASSREFSTLCPASAVLMTRDCPRAEAV
jgi:amino-acid N-acetyltransferase